MSYAKVKKTRSTDPIIIIASTAGILLYICILAIILAIMMISDVASSKVEDSAGD